MTERASIQAATDRLLELLGAAKALSREYYELTGRPLGITGEVAEYEATRLLDLELAPPRQRGFDATRKTKRGKTEKLQIKGRRLPPGASLSGQRVGSVDPEKPWDYVLLVLLDEQYEATVIYEAEREAVVAALAAPGSRARQERGQLSVAKFKAIGHPIWSRPA